MLQNSGKQISVLDLTDRRHGPVNQQVKINRFVVKTHLEHVN